MSMKKILLAFSIPVVLVGCVTPQYNYIPEVQELSKPPIGEVATAHIGDHMLTQGRMVQQDSIYFSSPQKVNGNQVSTGYFAKQGEDKDYEYFKISTATDAGKITQGVLKDPPMGFAIRKSDNNLCILTIYNMVIGCTSDAQYERKNWASASKDSFQQTLIYNGKVGNKINIGYREFSSDLARPAFNNDVEYDLSQSKQIGYKGALLDVIDANNQQIKYKVIRNFNK